MTKRKKNTNILFAREMTYFILPVNTCYLGPLFVNSKQNHVNLSGLFFFSSTPYGLVLFIAQFKRVPSRGSGLYCYTYCESKWRMTRGLCACTSMLACTWGAIKKLSISFCFSFSLHSPQNVTKICYWIFLVFFFSNFRLNVLWLSKLFT